MLTSINFWGDNELRKDVCNTDWHREFAFVWIYLIRNRQNKMRDRRILSVTSRVGAPYIFINIHINVPTFSHTYIDIWQESICLSEQRIWTQSHPIILPSTPVHDYGIYATYVPPKLRISHHLKPWMPLALLRDTGLDGQFPEQFCQLLALQTRRTIISNGRCVVCRP